jgi:probable HAF family extracellular repeat protein
MGQFLCGRGLRVAQFLALAAAIGGSYQASAQQAYEVADLGTLGGATSVGYGINDAGQVVGSATTAGDAATHAFLFSQGRMVDLGTLGGTTSVAYAINASGQVVGYASVSGGANHAATWTGATATDLGTNGATESYARGIDSFGHIVGIAGSQSGNCSGTATYWSGTAATALPIDPANTDTSSQAYSINDSGQIVGCVYNATAMQDLSVTWAGSATLYTALPNLGFGGEAYAIINNGVMVGEVDTPIAAASLWSGGKLDTGPGSLSYGANAFAYGVNAAGQIVGTGPLLGTVPGARATLWISGASQVIDLNSTLRPQVALANTLTEARAINTAGLIVANGTVAATGASHAFLLTPVTATGTPSVTLSASPASVLTGESFVLTWTSANAWACSAGGSGPSGSPWTGILATSGTQTIHAGSAAGSVTATLSCSLGNQQSAPVQAVVAVNDPSLTVTLSASPTPIVSGGSTTVTWTSVNATTCTASGGGMGDGWAGTSQATNGSVMVTEPVAVASPLTLTFTLTCSNSGTGQATAASTKVVINPTPAATDSGAGGGGGEVDPWSLLGLTGILLLRRRQMPALIRRRLAR